MISVIMPVYNSEKYLENAIKSVLSQTYKNFELICVNDGSTDKSLQILQKFSKKDKRCVIIDKPNGGISSARNVALERANGDYIAFIDNDDLYTENLLEDNYAIALKYNADIVRFGVSFPQNEEMIQNKLLKTQKMDEKPAVLFKFEEALKNYSSFRQKYLSNVWNALYKKSLIDSKKLRFNEFYKYAFEDWMFNFEVFFSCKTIVVNPAKYYIHFVRMNYSTSQKWHINRLDSYLDGKKREVALCELNKLDGKVIANVVAWYVMLVSRDIWGKPNGMRYKEKKDYMDSLHWETELKYFDKSSAIKGKSAILAFLYTKKLYFFQMLVVKMWKIKYRLRGKYF